MSTTFQYLVTVVVDDQVTRDNPMAAVMSASSVMAGLDSDDPPYGVNVHVDELTAPPPATAVAEDRLRAVREFDDEMTRRRAFFDNPPPAHTCEACGRRHRRGSFTQYDHDQMVLVLQKEPDVDGVHQPGSGDPGYDEAAAQEAGR